MRQWFLDRGLGLGVWGISGEVGIGHVRYQNFANLRIDPPPVWVWITYAQWHRWDERNRVSSIRIQYSRDSHQSTTRYRPLPGLLWSLHAENGLLTISFFVSITSLIIWTCGMKTQDIFLPSFRKLSIACSQLVTYAHAHITLTLYTNGTRRRCFIVRGTSAMECI